MSKKKLGSALLVAAVAVTATALVGTSGAASKAKFKAGLVSDVGRFNDKGFNQNQLDGLKMAKAKLGVEIRAIESHAASDYIPNFTSLARQNYDAIVGAGFLLAEQLATVAKKFPNIQFAITDYPVQIPPFSDAKGKLLVKNITGLTFKAEEPSYLIGCLAALQAKKEGGKTIGVVGGVKIPPVDAFLAGYKAGAQKCAPGTKVLIGYSQTFIEQDKCKEVAANHIAAGSKVEFNVAGPCGFGTLNAAKEGGVWGVGVDVDQSYLGAHILTSVIKRVDLGVFRFIQGVKDGTITPGNNLVFTLKNEGVGVGKMSSKVPAASIAKMNALREQIIAGKIKVPTSL